MEALNELSTPALLSLDRVSAPRIYFTNFLLSRRCNLEIAFLKHLQASDIVRLFEELMQLKRNRTEQANALIEQLYQFISILSDEERIFLIQLKRDLFNGRSSSLKAKELLLLYKREDILKKIDFIESLDIKISEVAYDIQKEYQSYLHSIRQLIADLQGNENVLKSLQLSGNRLLGGLKKYLSNYQENKTITKKMRQEEDTFLSYLCRMALKPTPFSSFTTINTYLDDPSFCEKTSNDYRFCLLSRAILDWLINQCLELDFLKARLPLRVNSTYKIQQGKIFFFACSAENKKNIYGLESYLSMSCSGLLAALIDLLEEKNINRDELSQALIGFGYSKEELADYIEKLIKIGLIERRLIIPDQTIRYPLAVGHYFKSFDNETVVRIGDLFLELHHIEIQFQYASSAQRKALLINVEQSVSHILKELSVPSFDFKEIKSFLYEDVGNICFGLASNIDYFKKYDREFYCLLKLLPILDNALIERLSIYDFYRKLYSSPGETEDFLDFYRRFATLDSETLTHIMMGSESAEVKELRSFRERWLNFLESTLTSSPHAECITLDITRVKDFVDEIPEHFFDVHSVIFYVQKCFGKNSSHLVLDSAAMGGGAFYSRFCNIYGEDSPLVQTQFIHALGNEVLARSCDIGAIFGMNTNLHPPFCGKTIEYPGCLVDEKNTPYKLKDLLVRADDRRKRLSIVHKITGEELNLNPLNFLFPVAGPSLYRFLYLFTPFLNYKRGFWRLIMDRHQHEPVKIFPRLALGGIILDRKTWIFSKKFLQNLSFLREGILPTLEGLKKWQQDYQLPEMVFYHQINLDKKSEDWVKIMEKHIGFAQQIKLRKPHFLNFNSPVLIRIFEKHLSHEGADILVLQECLPEVNFDDDSSHFREEFLLQVNRQ